MSQRGPKEQAHGQMQCPRILGARPPVCAGSGWGQVGLTRGKVRRVWAGEAAGLQLAPLHLVSWPPPPRMLSSGVSYACTYCLPCPEATGCLRPALTSFLAPLAVHCGSIRQTATILSMDKDCLRTGDKATVHFRFIKTPEYLHIDQRLVFREGRTKAVGTITKVNLRQTLPATPA